MTGTETATSMRYRRFAEVEARGYSPTYDTWCTGVSTDAELLRLLDTLPPARRQPVLFLGATRFLGVPLGDYAVFRSFVLGHWERIRQLMQQRTTQTNEAGRCAVLLPSLASIASAEGRPWP